MFSVKSLSVIAILVSVVSLLIAWRIGARTLRITTYRSATDLMLEVDRLFVAHPKLRPYFYENVACPRGHADHHRVQAIAELELDVLECIWDGSRTYSKADRESWAKYINDTLKRSPALQAMRADPRKQGWYPTLDLLSKVKGQPATPQQGWLSRVRQLAMRRPSS